MGGGVVLCACKQITHCHASKVPGIAALACATISMLVAINSRRHSSVRIARARPDTRLHICTSTNARGKAHLWQHPRQLVVTPSIHHLEQLPCRCSHADNWRVFAAAHRRPCESALQATQKLITCSWLGNDLLLISADSVRCMRTL